MTNSSIPCQCCQVRRGLVPSFWVARAQHARAGRIAPKPWPPEDEDEDWQSYSEETDDTEDTGDYSEPLYTEEGEPIN